MADFKVKYPASNADTTEITITLASLASDTNILAGRESTAVVNVSNLDLDHLLSGVIRTGTSPTAGKQIEVWVYAPIKVVSGTPTYPDVLDGTDSNETITSRNVLGSACRLAQTIIVDATSDRDYPIAPVSIASLFGGSLPTHWGVFVVHNTAVALNSTGSNHYLHYQRVQAQSV
jgi:hypothetical protein